MVWLFPLTSEKGMPGSPFFNDIRNNKQPLNW